MYLIFLYVLFRLQAGKRVPQEKGIVGGNIWRMQESETGKAVFLTGSEKIGKLEL